MRQALSFDKTLMSSLNTKVTVSKWYDAKDRYDENKYKEAILELFDYVNLDIRKKYGNDNETYFKVPHGSVVVEVEFTDTHFKVKAPFLKVGADKRVPLFRKVAEVNFAPLNLAQIKLEGEQLNFHYTCPWHLCEPYKIYYVLQEICHNADNFDDEFISLFDVSPLHEPQITNYDAATLDTAWAKYNDIIKEAEAYMQYFDQNRMEYFNWDILNITFKKIEYLIMPNGKLRTDLEKQIGDLYSKDHMQDRIQRGKSFLARLKAKSKEEYLDDIYEAESFISIKSRLEHDALKQNWKRPYESAAKEIQDKQYTGAVLTLLVGFYDMYYYNNVPDDINDKVVTVLGNASGQDWHVAATTLYNGMTAILENRPVKGSSGKKGFFSKLFG